MAAADPPAKLALHARDGSLRGYATIDAVNAHRWYLDGRGYVVRALQLPDGRWSARKLHRDLLGLKRGDRRQGDHRNHDLLDNRRSNLRIVTNAQNGQNRNGAYRGSTSRHRGVCWAGREAKWRVTACVDGRRFHLGYFDDEQEAAGVAAAFRAEHMPYSAEAAA